MNDQSRPKRIVRMRETSVKTSLRPSTIHDLVDRGLFPKPFKLVPGGRAAGWFEDCIDQYLIDRSNEAQVIEQGEEQEMLTVFTEQVITLYSRQYKTARGAFAQQKITFNAKNLVNHYKPYSYFGVHCSTDKKDMSYSWRECQGPYTEWLLRARRCVAFADTTELKPVKFNVKKHNDVWEEIRVACNLDHTTIWMSDYGTLFLLTEPYCDLEDKPDTLINAGFSYIEIPLNLSPYCGGCDGPLSTANKPWTKSYLITLTAQQAELSDINDRLRLAAQSALPWNDMSGVRNV